MAFKAYKDAFKAEPTRNRTACFIQLVVYIFNCFPVLLDYIFGRPTYSALYWWRPMGTAIENDGVSIIYDIYMLLAMAAMHYIGVKRKFCVRHDKRKSKKSIKIYNSKGNWFFYNKPVLIVCILSPIISMIVRNNWRYYIIYGMTETRGIEQNFSLLSMNNLLLLSLWAFCMLFFERSKKYKIRDLLIIIIYSVIIAWICGKRYIIANMAFMYMFFFVQSERYNKKFEKLLRIVLPVGAIILVVFSVYYLTTFKNSVLLTRGNTEAVYETLRADFGRDDVTKYVIKKEFFENDSFLEYPLQSFLSAIFVWVPRSLWTTKPFQHFEYLTASIKGVSVLNHGPGMTPSWYEMCLANFKVFGFIIGILSVPIMCRFTDIIDNLEIKSVFMMMIIAILTQSIDAYIIYIAILMIAFVLHIVFGKRKVILSRKRKQILPKS